MMRIAVYSGSFNPLHIGHLAVIRKALEFFDRVYLVVSPKNPLKTGISADSAGARHDAACKTVARHPELEGRVKVDDVEFGLPVPNYTYMTLDCLKEREPENEFTLIMGGDQIADFRRWREYRHILKEYGVAVYPREGYDAQGACRSLSEEDSSYKIMLLDSEMVDISSTEIREGLEKGLDMSSVLM